MGLFSKIEGAQYSEGGNYVKPGVFRFEIKKVFAKVTRKAQNAFLAELKVLESTNPEHVVGSECTWMCTLDKEPALGNIKNFIAAAAGCEMNQVNEEAAEMVVSDKNPLAGKIVRASAINILTRAKTPFTKVKFFKDADGGAAVAAEHTKQAA